MLVVLLVVIAVEQRMMHVSSKMRAFRWHQDTFFNYHEKPFCSRIPGTDPCIFDVGFHRGYATKDYLDDGFKVLAIEANPELLGNGHSELAEYVFRDRLRLIGVGISEQSGTTTPFYVNKNDAWSSLDMQWGCRDGDGKPAESVQAKWCSKIQTRTATCAELILSFGRPLYMRVSLENKDYGCLDGLRSLPRSQRPEFISVGNTDLPFVQLLISLGYNHFKVVDMYFQQSKTAEELRELGTSPADWGHSALHLRQDQNWRTVDELIEAFPLPSKDSNGETLWYSLHGYRA